MRFRRINILTGLFLALLIMVSCSQDPGEIHYGSDECAHCKMMITDSRFASQIVTSKGKPVKFDAIECMSAYFKQNRAALKDARLWVSNFSNPGTWIDAKEAYYVKSDQIQSPMGESLLAFITPGSRESHLAEYPGQELSWNELMK